MQRTGFDFDVITGPSSKRPMPKPEPKSNAGSKQPAAADVVTGSETPPRTSSARATSALLPFHPE